MRMHLLDYQHGFMRDIMTGVRQRRGHGTGTFFLRNDGLWIGRMTVPVARGEKRKQRQTSSKLFCAMLRKYSQIPAPEPRCDSLGSRKENLARARQSGSHTKNQFYAVCRAQKGLCYYCGQGGSSRKPREMFGRLVDMPLLVKDHKIPLVRGGSDSIDNIVGACDGCNSRKGTLTDVEFLAVLRG